MDHVVYLDAKAQELKKILSGEKTMIIRGATGRKLPHGRVFEKDVLYFVENNGDAMIRAKAVVREVFCSDKLEVEASTALVTANQDALMLSPAQVKRWAGKRYLVLVTIEEACGIEPFELHKEAFGNMDDWLLVESIERVRV